MKKIIEEQNTVVVDGVAMEMSILREKVGVYKEYLRKDERSDNTINQYGRDINCFLNWMEDCGISLVKETIISYKEMLQSQLRPSSVNTKLAAINSFLDFLERSDLKVKQLKIQRQVYSSSERELTKEEYLRLINTAKRQGNWRLVMLVQTICSTGIRVSELRFITAEAVRCGTAFVQLKGKSRMILLPEKLCRLLKDYLKQERITTGPVFVTRNGKPLDRSNIWRMMKCLCESARVASQKVFPHNLRHLFARCFYKIDKDIAKLADILGHSNISTTRIYIISTGEEHRQQMNELGLVAG